jgi:hypothetical protein
LAGALNARIAERRTELNARPMAATIAESLDDHLRQGWALAQLGGHAWISENQLEALDLSTRAHEIAVGAGDVPLQVHASLRVAWAYHTLGDYRRAVDFLLESIAPLEGDRGLGLRLRTSDARCHASFPAGHLSCLCSIPLASTPIIRSLFIT